MTDQWVPAPPQPAPPDPPNGLPPANTWSPVTPCASADSPSIADGVLITGRPAVISAQPWQITVNDGGSPANFSIDHFDASGELIESPIFIDGSSGDVLLTHDPTQPLGVATKQYADNNPNYVAEAPINNTTYGRDNGTWVPLPGSYLPEAPNTTQRYGRFNSIWQLDAIQTDAPNDGGAYARQSGAWTAAVTGGPYLPLTGGTLTGPVTMQGSNMLALNAPLASGQSAIIGQKATIPRWQMMLGDQTAEGTGNVGSNFALNAFSTTGAMLGTWLSIARADGATTFNGSGVTIAGGLACNGLLAVNNVGNLSVPGGSSGQVLSTNGSGLLSWATRLTDAPSDGQFYTRQNAAWAIAPGGMTDAPNDGTAYARKSAAWAHLTHTDITDWTATLAPYALTTSLPAASTTTPAMDGTATIGVGTTYARADHIHPSDTSRAPLASPTFTGTPAAPTASPGVSTTQVATTAFVGAAVTAAASAGAPNPNRLDNGDMWVDQHNSGASVAVPAAGSGSWLLDRWGTFTTLAKLTAGQNYSVATKAPNFPYFLGMQVTGTGAAPAAAATNLAAQAIEYDTFNDFGWGTANAQPATLSFWVNSSLTGNFGVYLQGVNSPYRVFITTYNIPTANTWTKIIVPIPADTTISSTNWTGAGNASGLSVGFDLGTGANAQTSAGLGAWQNSTTAFAATGSVKLVATSNAKWAITGVKLELGSVATAWLHEDLPRSLARCQRYYVGAASGTYANPIIQGYAPGPSNSTYVQWSGPVTMRAAPTISAIWTGGANATANSVVALVDNRTIQSSITSVGAGGYTATLQIGSLSAEI